MGAAAQPRSGLSGDPPRTAIRCRTSRMFGPETIADAGEEAARLFGRGTSDTLVAPGAVTRFCGRYRQLVIVGAGAIARCPECDGGPARLAHPGDHGSSDRHRCDRRARRSGQGRGDQPRRRPCRTRAGRGAGGARSATSGRSGHAVHSSRGRTGWPIAASPTWTASTARPDWTSVPTRRRRSRCPSSPRRWRSRKGGRGLAARPVGGDPRRP